MNVDLSKAVEAAKASYGYPLDSTESADLHGAITAAFPLIVEALRADMPKLWSDGYKETVSRWLARIAQEVPDA